MNYRQTKKKEIIIPMRKLIKDVKRFHKGEILMFIINHKVPTRNLQGYLKAIRKLQYLLFKAKIPFVAFPDDFVTGVYNLTEDEYSIIRSILDKHKETIL